MNFLISLMILVAALLSSGGAMAMMEIEDGQLSEITGQALLQMGATAGLGGSSDITFYKAGLDAVVELNMNIEKLQLGCTAASVNGQYCDIDIDHMSLTGADETSNRPASNAILTRPFFEFAIKNDGSKTMREVVGIRLSAEQALGMLTTGFQEAGAAFTAGMSNNGINSLSGYMRLGTATGVATTAERYMCYSTAQCSAANGGDGSVGLSTIAGTAARMTGRIYANLSLGTTTADFYSDVYQLRMQSAQAGVTTSPVTISGKRLTFVELTGSGVVNPVNFSGQMQANANILGGINLQKDVSGTIQGLTADVQISQSLGLIHKIYVNNPFSLSFQRQGVLWPGAAAAAQTGWWMAFEDEIDIGSISPEAQVQLTNAVLMQALTGDNDPSNGYQTNNSAGGNNWTCAVPSINCALYRGHSFHTSNGTASTGIHGIDCIGLGDCLGGSLAVGTLTVPVNLTLPLTDLKLGAQAVTPNCWGTARFC